MKTVRYKLEKDKKKLISAARINPSHVDRTTEHEIRNQKKQDAAEAALDAAQFTRNIREQLGLSQSDFASRIHVSLDTIRNWEQGKRSPTGAAKALLKIIHKAPKVALQALE